MEKDMGVAAGAAPLKAGHTPTPWIKTPAGGRMSNTYSQPFAIVEYGQANLVAGCFGDVRGGHDVARANAAFIVLAVNAHDRLVEALEFIRAMPGPVIDGPTGPCKFIAHPVVAEVIDQALASAKAGE